MLCFFKICFMITLSLYLFSSMRTLLGRVEVSYLIAFSTVCPNWMPRFSLILAARITSSSAMQTTLFRFKKKKRRRNEKEECTWVNLNFSWSLEAVHSTRGVVS
jgi:hypothetical protein